jgi:O-antigen/teichoic acid export membrane protein
MRLGLNVVASIGGQTVRAVTGFIFVPIYVRYIGVEAYGLIGIFAVLQTWLVLLDFGLRPALGREMARFSAGAHTPQWIRDLLRTVELIGVSLSLAVALGVGLAAPWLSEHWVTSTTLEHSTVRNAFTLMGVVTALRFVENIYTSCLVGLQRQVQEATVSSVSNVVRGVGAIGVLAWLSPTIEGFFLWQCFTSVATIAVLARLTYAALPRGERRARADRTTLHGVRAFAGGMVALTLQSLLITNLDKLMLSRLLPLKDFGSYALAGVAANALAMLAQPVATSLMPRLTEVTTRADDRELARVYHLGSQTVAVLGGSAAVVLMTFSARFLLLWTQNAELATTLSPLLTLMVLGSLLNALGYMPYHLQLAHGWTRLAFVYNVFLIVTLVPALAFVVPRWGAEGAAAAWACLNLLYLIINIPLMHLKLLPTELWTWYANTLAPIAVATGAAVALQRLLPDTHSRLAEFLVIAGVSALTLGAALLAAPALRREIVKAIAARTASQQ